MSRESRTVVISHGSHTIRAGFGIHEPLKTPSITLTARVGLRRSHIEKIKHHQQQQQQQQQHQSTEVETNGNEETPTKVADDATATHQYIVHPSDYLVGHFLEDALKHPENYLDDPVSIFWPMVEGKIQDYQGMQALWYYLLFFSLPVIRSSNSSVTLLSLPSQAITRQSSSEIHKIFFEEFNVPAFCLIDSALTCSFAVGQTNACVVDVGWKGSTVTCVLDALQVNTSTRISQVGIKECIAYLASLFSNDSSVTQALQTISAGAASQSSLLLDLAEEIFLQGHVCLHGENGDVEAQENAQSNSNVDDEGNFDVLGALTSGREKEAIAEQERRNKALIEQGKEPEKVVTASDANKSSGHATGTSTPNGETTSVDFRSTRIRIPNAMLDKAATPLLDPSVLSKVDEEFMSLPAVPTATTSQDPQSRPHWQSTPSLSSVIADSINSIPDLDRRNALWELLVITGASTSVIKNLTSCLVSSLSTFVVGGGNISTGLVSIAGGGGGNTTSGLDTSDGAANGSIGFSGAQPSNVRALKTPDYFHEFKDRTDLAPFLGATIYAKLVFADSQARGYVTKNSYIANGPNVAFMISNN